MAVILERSVTPAVSTSTAGGTRLGVAMTLGVAMRLAAGAGALLYLMRWTVVLPPGNNPVLVRKSPVLP